MLSSVSLHSAGFNRDISECRPLQQQDLFFAPDFLMGVVFFCFLHFSCIGLCFQISLVRLCSLVEGFGPCSVRDQTPLCQKKPKLTVLLCRALCRDQDMEGYIELSANPTLYLQRNVFCCSDLSARETLAQSRPCERSSHGSLGA